MGISFVIPFYDEVLFLEQTIVSILQIEKDIHEIIVVNDLPGHNQRYLAQIAKLDRRICIQHNAVNLGASGSRNAGLENVSGEYVSFIDSDDFISARALEGALKYAKSTGADMVHLPTLVMSKKQRHVYKFYRDNALFARRVGPLPVERNPSVRYGAAAWSFLYKRDFLIEKGVKFDPRLRKYEDHLFILNATQNADSIATYDKWCRVWLRRGGSLSTSKTNITDFRMQIESFAKCTSFLGTHLETDSVGFQRDLAFCFHRLISDWTLLYESLPRRRDQEVIELLLELKQTVEKYELSEQIYSDALLKRMFGDSIMTKLGDEIPISILPEIYRSIALGDWDKVEKACLIPPNNSVFFASSSQQTLPYAFQRVDQSGSKLEAHFELALQRSNGSNASQTPALNEAAPDCERIVFEIGDPLALLFEDYKSRILNPETREMRTPSEYLLDEMDALIAYVNFAVENMSSTSESVLHSTETTLEPTHLLEDLQEIFQSHLILADHPSTKLNAMPQCSDMVANLSLAIEEAVRDTRQYINAKIGRRGQESASVSRSDILLDWRNIETRLAPNMCAKLSVGLIEIAENGRHGDADWLGRRTIRSRLRALKNRP